MRTLSVVIPAYNEAENIRDVVASIPTLTLEFAGWRTEVVVVDNASTDGTGDLARRSGARVVHQPLRGYGNAYKAGFAAAAGSVIVTGDADRTYPLDHIPALLEVLDRGAYEFITTNRLLPGNREAMKVSHEVGNRVLSGASRALFRNRIIDSQSGMWMFRRHVWPALDVRSGGMAFSQEIKNEASIRGFRCTEVDIEYRPRGGEVKLHATRDGMHNLSQLFAHRLRHVGRRRARVALAQDHADLEAALDAAPSLVGQDGVQPGSVAHGFAAEPYDAAQVIDLRRLDLDRPVSSGIVVGD